MIKDFPSYESMTVAEVRQAVAAIVGSSSSKEEIRTRLEVELGYHGKVMLYTGNLIVDEVVHKIRALTRNIGGLMMANKTMAMIVINGPDRSTICL